MIAHLRGIVSKIAGGSVVVDVSGVGYLVSAPTDTISMCKVGQEALLHTVQIVREDSVQLFGFIEEHQVEVFNLLCSVGGVGAKTALNILSQLGTDGIERAVVEADAGAFSAVSGIGPKTAKLIILSLSGKLITGEEGTEGDLQKTVVSALVNLGYQEKIAKQATLTISKENPNATEEQLLRLTLNSLANSRRNASNER